MRARWINKWPTGDAGIIGQAVVASWLPGRYYFVSTFVAEGSSRIARLTEAIKTERRYDEVISAPDRYVTNIIRCSKHGIIGNELFDCPLFQRDYANVSEAQKGHELTLVLLERGDWSALRALSMPIE